MPRVDVMMDDGGAIRHQSSEDFLFTSQFGGCTAIYAYTENGMFALYHLRSTQDAKTIAVADAKDSNQPYRQWVESLKIQAKGEKIHFQMGTPWYPGKSQDLMQTHPELGMERYLRKLCKVYGIEDYDITLMNMIGVKSVAVNANGMVCFTANSQKIGIQAARYQTDEDIFENSNYTTSQCLRYIKASPNIDFDGKLQQKYQQRYDAELIIAKQQQMKARLQSLQQERDVKIKQIRDPLLVATADMLDNYQRLSKHTSCDEAKTTSQLHFMSLLFDAVQSMDSMALQALKKFDSFDEITQDDSLISWVKGQARTELGKMFDEAERVLACIDDMNSQPIDFESMDNESSSTTEESSWQLSS